MMKAVILFLLTLVSLLAGGCIAIPMKETSTREFGKAGTAERNQIEQIKPGQTNRTEIEEWFGCPDRSWNDDLNTVYIADTTRGEWAELFTATISLSLLGAFPIIQGSWGSKYLLMFEFDHQDLVQRYRLEELGLNDKESKVAAACERWAPAPGADRAAAETDASRP